MKTLLILRHAKSSWSDGDVADHDRKLNKRGKQDAPRVGRLLAEQDLVPEQIVSSTAKRARKTAALVAESCGYQGAVELRSELYGAMPEAMVQVLGSLFYDDNRVMLVGHNPGLENFLEVLTGRFERLPTAALAQVNLPILVWQELGLQTQGELVNVWRPKELG